MSDPLDLVRALAPAAADCTRSVVNAGGRVEVSLRGPAS